ncbi:MAG: hypothetical protein IJJ70_09555 [Treponema sp.]|nr:hypothetical protein [Treponema sp.]MBR0487928.1 hypothetical protein [Treponema sp.]
MADKLTRKEKREQKIAARPIKSFSVARVYLNVLGRPSTIPTAYKFLFTVIKNYLGTQFFQKWGIYKIPVVKVDHPLDKKIPFTPEKVDTYMDFVNLFLRPLSMLIKRFGGHKAAKTCNEWFSQLTRIYCEAGRMYRNTLSTMERPEYKDNFHFRIIHAWDPHLLCVPSLHIAIIVYCFSFYKAKFKELGFSDAECFQKNTELYNDAVAIAESVLYVKQHSVNCIPAALYMITKLYPELFTPNDATNFINDMFLSAPTVSPKDACAIKEHISFMYERFLLEGYAADDWRDPVIRWINEYDAKKEATAALEAEIAEEK